MKTQLKYSWLLALGLIILPAFLNARNIEETIISEHAFEVEPDMKLEIFNKYGSVHINTWQSDSLIIRTTQLFQAYDRKQLDRLKSTNSISITETQHIVLVKSQFANSARDLLSLLPVDISTPNEVKVNIEIWMPESLNLTLENRYGDVFIAPLYGDAYIDVAHGHFKANSFYGKLVLNTAYCNTTIGFINDGKITTRYCDLNIDSAKTVNLDSRSTDLILGHCNHLKVNGRNDNLIVHSSDALHLEGYFSKADFDIIYGDVYTKTNYGHLGLTFPKGYDGTVQVFSNYTDIELKFSQHDGSYPVNITHQKSRIMYSSKGTSLKEEKVSGKDVIYKTSGAIGSGKSMDGGLNVELFSGELKLIVK
jgi:hypothetical protein